MSNLFTHPRPSPDSFGARALFALALLAGALTPGLTSASSIRAHDLVHHSGLRVPFGGLRPAVGCAAQPPHLRLGHRQPQVLPPVQTRRLAAAPEYSGRLVLPVHTESNDQPRFRTSAMPFGPTACDGSDLLARQRGRLPPPERLPVRSRQSSAAVNGTALNTIAGGGSSPGPASGQANQVAVEPEQEFFDAAQNALYVSDYYSVIRKINLSTGVMTIVAGTGVQSNNDTPASGPAISAVLGTPQGLFVDASSNIFFADSRNSVIQMVAAGASSPFLPGQTLTAGNIYTVAGGGQTTVSGGIVAISAQLNGPNDVTEDPAGNLIIADSDNRAVELVAGSTTVDPLLPGVTPKPGNIYVLAGTVGTYGNSGTGGPATAANLCVPEGVAMTPSGNLAVSDSCNSVIWLVAGSKGSDPLMPATTLTQGDIYQPVTSGLSGPEGIAVDGDGNLYIADVNDEKIQLAAAASPNPLLPGQTLTPGSMYTVAGTGSADYNGDGEAATSASLYNPAGIAVDGSQNLYIADTSDNRVRKVSSSSDDISTVAGDGLWYEDGVPAAQSQMSSAASPIVDAKGDLLVADDGDGTIRLVAAGSSSPFLPGRTLTPGDIYTIAGGEGPYGGGEIDSGPALQTSMRPLGLALDSKGNLLLADSGNQTIRLVASTTSSPFVSGTLTPGDIYLVAGTPGSRGFAGDGAAATVSELSSPYDVAVDASGNLLIDDAGNNRIRLVATGISDSLMPGQTLTAGDIYTVAGGGANTLQFGVPATSLSLDYPTYFALDPAGNLYLADGCNIAVVAGTSSDPLLPGQTMQAGYAYQLAGKLTTSCYRDDQGDGGPALLATTDPGPLAVDAKGNLYINDMGNGEIRIVAAQTSNPLLPGQALTRADIYGLAGYDDPIAAVSNAGDLVATHRAIS